MDVEGETATHWPSLDPHVRGVFEAYAAAYPELAAEFTRRMAGDMPVDWEEKASAFIRSVDDKAEKVATRKASQNAIEGYGPLMPDWA